MEELWQMYEALRPLPKSTHFHNPLRLPSCPLQLVSPPHRSPEGPLISLSLVCLFRISHKWSQTVCILLSLTSFTQHDVLRFLSMFNSLFFIVTLSVAYSFYCEIFFHCMSLSQFVYWCTSWWIFNFWLLQISFYERSHTSLCVNISVYFPWVGT